MKRVARLVALSLLGLLASMVACLAADPVGKTGEKRDTLLYVRTMPPGAKVLLDGKELGVSNGTFAVEPGVAAIRVELEGHKAGGKQVTIRADRVTRIELVLEPESADSEVASLIAKLSTPEEPRFQALNALIKLKKAAVPMLIEEMKTNNNWQIPKALGAIGDKRAIEPLIDKLAEGNGSPMREVVVESLQLLTKEDFGSDVEKWRDWWNREGKNTLGTGGRLAEDTPKPNKGGPKKGDAAQFLRQGWRLWQERRLDEAAEQFRQAVALAPDNANAWNGLGWATFNSGKHAEAEKAFLRVVAIAPGHPAALNGLGQLYLAQKKYQMAEKYLLKAAPKAPAAWYGLARLYLLQGKFKEAEKYAQMMVDAGQADKVGERMLQAAKEKRLGEGLRLMIEPQPIESDTAK